MSTNNPECDLNMVGELRIVSLNAKKGKMSSNDFYFRKSAFVPGF